MNILLKRYAIPVGIALLPLSAFAQTKLTDVLTNASDFFDLLIIFFFLLATAVFLWGIIKYLTAGGDEEKSKEARSMIIWGIIFLAVMVAVWAFVNIVLDFVFGSKAIPGVPPGPQQ